jgi:hypothetical protein
MLLEQVKLSVKEGNDLDSEGAELFLNEASFLRQSFKSAMQYIVLKSQEYGSDLYAQHSDQSTEL